MDRVVFDGCRSLSGISGIYKIVDMEAGLFYIGSSNNLGRRLAEHRCDLRRGTHPAKYMQRCFSKHGESAFQVEIVERVPVVELVDREQHWIDTLQPAFNWAREVRTPQRGRPLSEETKRKISESKRGQPGWWRGRKRSADQIQKMRQLMLGKKPSPETRVRMSASLRGLKHRVSEQGKEAKRANLIRALAAANPRHTENRRRGASNHKARAIVIDGIRFGTVKDAASHFGVSRQSIRIWRIKGRAQSVSA